MLLFPVTGKNRDKIINSLEEFFLTKDSVSSICSRSGITLRAFSKGLRSALGLSPDEPNLYKILPDGRKLCSVCRSLKFIHDFPEKPLKTSYIIDTCLSCLQPTTKYRLGDNYELHKRIQSKLTNKIINAITRPTKGNQKLDFTGCSTEFLKQHIENQFKPGMTWENHGLWHLDHIVPCTLFNLTNDWEAKSCFKWENLQPLWAAENLSKNDEFDLCPV